MFDMCIHCEMTTIIKWINVSFTSDTRIPRWRTGKESTYQCKRHKRHGFDSWVGKSPWRRKRQPTPVPLPGKLMDRGIWWATVHGVTELDMTEWPNTHITSNYQFFFRCMMFASLILREIKPQRVITSYLLEWVSSIRWEKIIFFQDVENRDPVKHCWSECKWIQPLWKTMWFLKKLKIDLSNDSAISLLGVSSKERKSLSWRGICTPVFIVQHYS